VNKAEVLDPTNPELKLLLDDVNTGMEQIKRKELIAELENKVFAASTPAELQVAAGEVQQALLQMPSESVLIQMKMQLDRRLKDQKRVIRRRNRASLPQRGPSGSRWKSCAMPAFVFQATSGC